MSTADTTATITMPELTTTPFPSNGQLLVEENEELVKASVAAVRADLDKTPAWSRAPTPTDDFLLMFLRSEMFCPEKAAGRYRKFWEVKVTVCGEDEAHLPIKAQSATQALKTQFIQLVPASKDVEGRQVVFLDVGNKDKSLCKHERIRAVWYVLLAALEDVETQRRGVCFVVSLKKAKLSRLDPKFDRLMMDSIQGTLPVRVGSINLCYPPSFFRVVWAIMSKIITKRVQDRIRLVPGTDQEVGAKLSNLVNPVDLPPPMGPKALDISSWLAQRERPE